MAMPNEPPTATEAAARIAVLEAEVERLAEAAERASCAKDDFLATLSHELRTPLNAIIGWLQLLRRHIHEPAERLHALDVLERNARTQAQIVNDLLDVSRVVTGSMRLTCSRVRVADLVRNGSASLTQAAALKQVGLSIEVDDDAAELSGDPVRLQQIVWNLVSNAVKFTPSGGEVHVRARCSDGTVEIEVSDTGIGIAPEVLPHVFDRFHQADGSLTRPFGGLGLGLALVRHLVELHGGSVHAASRGFGQGATFTVLLPAYSAETTEPATTVR